MAKRARPKGRSNHRPSGSFPAAGNGHGLIPASTPAPPRGPLPEAVGTFERGMAALQRHDYGSAADCFRKVLSGFPSEDALGERSRVYLALCEREMDRRPTAPRTVEERLTAATAALNNGDDGEAEQMVRGVLDAAPNHELALYLLAAVEARRGARDAALNLLTRAFDVSPEIRAQARHDLDFETLRDLDAFQQLLEAPIVRESQILNGQRRGRRPRAGR